MRNLALLIGLACVVAASGAAAKEPKLPTAKWVVDFDDAQCVAMRDYGTKKKPLFLVLKGPPMGDVMQVAVIQRGEGTKLAEQMHAVVTADSGPPMRVTIVSAAAQPGNTLFRMNLTHDQFTRVAASRSVRIDADSDLDERFALSDVAPLLRVLDRCVTDLRRVWNVKDKGQTDVPDDKSVSHLLTGVFSNEDYPAVSLDEDQDGTVTFALLIDEAGKVADCTVIKTSGVAALDAQSCAVVKARARFTPARGSDGKPVKSSMTSKVTWRIAG